MTLVLINQKVEKDKLGEYVLVKLYNQDIKDLNTALTSFVNRREADNVADDMIDKRSRLLKEEIFKLRNFMNPS
jgi:hypothetical protein